MDPSFGIGFSAGWSEKELAWSVALVWALGRAVLARWVAIFFFITGDFSGIIHSINGVIRCDKYF